MRQAYFVLTISLMLLLTFHLSGYTTSAYAAPISKGTDGDASTADPRSLELNEKGVQAVKARDYDLAERLFREALAADSYNLTAVHNLASLYLVNKKEQAAIELLKSTVNKHPEDPDLFLRLGDAFFSAENVSDALTNYEKSFALDSTRFETVSRLATTYSLKSDFANAEKFLLRAVEIKPNDLDSLANLSSVFLANAKANQAIGTAKRALQVRPEGRIYVTLGSAYEMLEDYSNAIISFEKAVQLGGIEDIEELNQHISKLKQSQG